VRRRYEKALSLGRQQIADETAEEVPTGASRTFRTVQTIFVSSLFRDDMAAIRQGGRSAVEPLGMYPVMFETQPASDRNSRRALG
jgi:hypothetical protein